MRLRDEKKEQKVRDRALELVVKLGLDGFSMQKLARAAGVSPATLYIYFKGKEDLILNLGEEIGRKMVEATFKGFDKTMDLETGLWIQWQNRSEYYLNNRLEVQFYDQLKLSAYAEKLAEQITPHFSEQMGGFIRNIIIKGEIEPVKPEVFWSVAFAPMFNLIRFHLDKKSMGGKPYILTEEDLKAAFNLVVKSLKK
jgi:TetR/AcrR family transcriptional repressor of multidrug resistance operon